MKKSSIKKVVSIIMLCGMILGMCGCKRPSLSNLFPKKESAETSTTSDKEEEKETDETRLSGGYRMTGYHGGTYTILLFSKSDDSYFNIVYTGMMGSTMASEYGWGSYTISGDKITVYPENGEIVESTYVAGDDFLSLKTEKDDKKTMSTYASISRQDAESVIKDAISGQSEEERKTFLDNFFE